MEQHKVAIITRTKNREVFLKRAVKSVTSQTFKDWIMVIVNDGGDSNKVDEVVEEYGKGYGSRIKTIHNEVSLGRTAAVNIGVKSSLSKYVVWHDDDDTWEPDFLEKCAGFLDSNTNPDIKGVVTHCTKVVEKVEGDEIIVQRKEPFATMKNASFLKIATLGLIVPIAFVYERSVFKETGYYDESLPVFHDWEFYLRYIEKYDIFVIPELLANYHIRLEVSQRDYGNTILVDREKRFFYENLIRNRVLRRDIEKGVLGTGFFSDLGKFYEMLGMKSERVERKVF